MPLSECDHHWTCLSARQRLEQVLNPIECNWTQLNALECLWTPLSEHWTRLNTIECSWVHVNAFEWVWMQLNALYYWFLNEIECAWMPLSECECNWTCLNVLECMWTPLSKYWIQLNALECTWMHVSTFERVLNLIECTWVWVNASEWVLNLREYAPLVEVIQKKINRAGSNWMREWRQTVILNIHHTSGSIRDIILMWWSTSVCILVIVQERFEKNHSYHMYVWLEALRIKKIWGIKLFVLCDWMDDYLLNVKNRNCNNIVNDNILKVL